MAAAETEEYSVEDEISAFFAKTSVARDTCDSVAGALAGDTPIVPVAVQGVCSYTVYAGPDLSQVVQFRIKSLRLELETAALARRVYGALAPGIEYKQQLGEEDESGMEPLLVYLMDRVRGVSRLDFILAHGFPEDSALNIARRKNLVGDVARFFSLAWKAPQTVAQADRDLMAATYKEELLTLLGALPDRFHAIIKRTLVQLPSILALPMVLTHKDFGDCNIMVNEQSYHLVGVIDWAEAEIAPFGMNLHSIQDLMSKLHMRNGWIRYVDYDDLVHVFWTTLSQEIGGLSEETIRAIKAARILGLLQSRGFTSRLANQPKTVPVQDDDNGRYNLMILEGLLLNPSTRFEDI